MVKSNKNLKPAALRFGTEVKPTASYEQQSGSRAPWFGAALMLGCFIFVFMAVLWLIEDNNFRIKRDKLVNDAETAGESIRLRLKGNLDYLLMLAKERSDGKLDAAVFQERAARFVADHPEMICINWVDAGFIITDVAPIAPNRQIIGLRLDLPEPKRASQLARDNFGNKSKIDSRETSPSSWGC